MSPAPCDLEAPYGVANAVSLIRIAMLGTRGAPASYSGFEICVEELGARLASRGHDVTAYCRVPHITFEGTSYRGMRLVKLPTIRSKHLDPSRTPCSRPSTRCARVTTSLSSSNVGSGAMTWIPRLAGQRVVLNVEELDWKRKKWGRFARWYIRASERWATRFPHRVVTDSRRVQEFYFARYGEPSSYIAEADVNRSLGVIHDGEQPRVEVVTDGQRVGPRAR